MIDTKLFEVTAAARNTYYAKRATTYEAEREEQEALAAYRDADAALQAAVRAELDAIEVPG